MNWGNAIDWIGTALGLPEMGISESVAGNKKTANTGSRGGSGTNTAAYQMALKRDQGGTGSNTPGSSAKINNNTPEVNNNRQGSTGGSYSGGGTSYYNPVSAEAINLRNQILGLNPDQLINELFSRIDNVANTRRRTRKSQYDTQISDLTDTLEKSIPEIERAYNAMGIGNSTYAGDSVKDTQDEFNKSIKTAGSALDEDLATIGNWVESQRGTNAENANRIRRTVDASKNSNDAYTLRANKSEIDNALGTLEANKAGMVEGSDAVNALGSRIGDTSKFDAAKESLMGIANSSIPTGTKEAAREALAEGLSDEEKKILSEIQINNPYGGAVA